MTRRLQHKPHPCPCGGTGWDTTDALDPQACSNPIHEQERQARLAAAEKEAS